MPVGIGTAIAGIATGIGLDAATAAVVGDIAGTALLGAGVGAAGGGLIAGVTGGNVLEGLGAGALTGGLIGGAGPLLGGALGIGTVGGDILAGTAGGALGSEITHGSPLTGALEGAGSGLLAGLTSPTGTGAQQTTSAGASAVGSAPPAGTSIPDISSLAGASGTGAITAGGGGVPDIASLSLGGQTGFTSGDVGVGGVSGSPLASTPQAAVVPSGGGAGLAPSAGTPGGFSFPGGGVFASAGGLPATGGIPVSGGGDGSFSTPGGYPVGGDPTQLAGTATGASGFDNNNILQTLGLKGSDIPKLALGAAPLGLALINQGRNSGLQSELKQEAQLLQGQGNQLQSYLQTGKLPPGAAVAIQNATAAAKAKIRSDYASRGMTGSSSESSDLAAIDQQAATQAFQIADQLQQQGLSESELSSTLYAQLIGLENQQSAEVGQAITGFAGALAGGGGSNTITIKAA